MAGEKAKEIVKSIETVIAAQEESDVREESRQESSREEPVQEKKMTVVMPSGRICVYRRSGDCGA